MDLNPFELLGELTPLSLELLLLILSLIQNIVRVDVVLIEQLYDHHDEHVQHYERRYHHEACEVQLRYHFRVFKGPVDVEHYLIPLFPC